MALPGTAGVVVALLLYVLFLSNMNFNDASQLCLLEDSLYINDYRKPSNMLENQVNKHFGFGRGALAATFIHPYFYNRAIRGTKTILKPQQSLAFVIAICLLLSGDIHQCPGSVNNILPTEGPYVNTANSRSTAGNLQVRSQSIPYYTLEQQTHLNVSISPAAVSTVAVPMTNLDVAANSAEPFGAWSGVTIWNAPHALATPRKHPSSARSSGGTVISADARGTGAFHSWLRNNPESSHGPAAGPTRVQHSVQTIDNIRSHLPGLRCEPGVKQSDINGRSDAKMNNGNDNQHKPSNAGKTIPKHQRHATTNNIAAPRQKVSKIFQTVNHAKILWDQKLKPKGIFGGHLNIREALSKKLNKFSYYCQILTWITSAYQRPG